MIGALTVAWTNQELQKCKEGKPYTFYKQEEKSFPYDCCKVDWNTIQRGNNHLMKFIFTSHLKPIIKLTGVIVGLSPMKWTGRNLCHQLNSWWVFNRLKGQGKVKLIYADIMNKLDVDGGMISYWDYETWDVVQSVEVHAVLCVLLQVELYPKTIKPLGLIYWYN